MLCQIVIKKNCKKLRGNREFFLRPKPMDPVLPDYENRLEKLCIRMFGYYGE